MKAINAGRFLLILIAILNFMQLEAFLSAKSTDYTFSTQIDQEVEETYKIEAEYINLYRQGSYKKALNLIRQVLEVRERKLGPDHLLTSNTVIDLAFTLDALGDQEEAQSSFKRVIRIREKALGENHPEVIRSLESYACFLGKARKIREAEKIESRIDEIIYADDYLKLPEDVVRGKAIKRVLPTYPEKLLQARISGTVVVRILIDESGKVLEASGRCGHELLVQAAVDAARNWKFQPTLVDEKPTKVRGRIRFVFKVGPGSQVF